LAARQAAEVHAKKERSKRKAAPIVEPIVVQPVVAVETKPEAPAIVAEPVAKANLAEGTLHKPTPKPGDKVVRPAAKKGVKTAPDKNSPWNEAGHKKRTPTTVDVRPGGWTAGRGRAGPRHHDKHAKQEETAQHAFSLPTERVVHEIMVPETITVAELAQKMSIKAIEIIKVLMNLGSMVTINQMLDQETAMIAVEELGHIAKPAKADDPGAYRIGRTQECPS
jgi:translation initiation factor IF-2